MRHTHDAHSAAENIIKIRTLGAMRARACAEKKKGDFQGDY